MLLLFRKLAARKIIPTQLWFPLTTDTIAWKKHYCDRNYYNKYAMSIGFPYCSQQNSLSFRTLTSPRMMIYLFVRGS